MPPDPATDAAEPVSLRPGDVLLYRGTSLVDRAIQLFDGSEMSHAAIVVARGEVGEARAAGLLRRSVEESVGQDHPRVVARRLKDEPATMDPVLGVALGYLEEKERYAYEQILLLALLALTRKLKVTPVLRALIRRTLDAAAGILAEIAAAGRQPMICSEFVFRCFDEALPQTNDIYTLEILGASLEATVTGVAAVSGPGRRRRPHPQSLIASAQRQAIAAGPLFQTAPRLSPPSRAEREELDALIAAYLAESGMPGTAAEVPKPRAVASPQDLTEAVASFSYALARGVPAPRALAPLAAADPVGYTAAVVADFVTPADLFHTPSLYTVGDVRKPVESAVARPEAARLPGTCLTIEQASAIVTEAYGKAVEWNKTLERGGLITENQRKVFRRKVLDGVVAKGCAIDEERIPADAETTFKEVRQTIQREAQ